MWGIVVALAVTGASLFAFVVSGVPEWSLATGGGVLALILATE